MSVLTTELLCGLRGPEGVTPGPLDVHHVLFGVLRGRFRNQAIAEFVAWAKASPSGAGLPPADGVYEFLTQRFPCPGNP